MTAADLRPGRVMVDVRPGFPEAIDTLCAEADTSRSFLRAAWYRAAAQCKGKTLIARRADGAIVAAVPMTRIGPDLVGAKAVPGSYWPFRAVLLAADAQPQELVAMLAHPLAQTELAPIWRLGPVAADDPSTTLVSEAAAMAGWTVRRRSLGSSWIFHLAEEVASGWPKKSTRKRLAAYERKLAERGSVSWKHISGTDWSGAVLDQLAAVEAESWVGQTTDGSGAKFLQPHQRGLWRDALADPVLASALSATLLEADGRAVAFSFDLRAGDTQYAIAGAYVTDLAEYRAGKLVTYRQLDIAAQQGVRRVDLGAGDSGYKREMGGRPGSELVDLLFVRNRAASPLFGLSWGPEPSDLRQLTLASPHRDDLALPTLRQIAAAAAVAGSAIAVVE